MRYNAGSSPVVYHSTLLFAFAAYTLFVVAFLTGYFDPYYFTEARATAHLQTVLGFSAGINPYDNAHLDKYGNLYSVIWPYLNYLVASTFGLDGYFEIKALMFALNLLMIGGAVLAAVYAGLRNGLNLLLAIGIGFSFLLLNTAKTTMGEFSYGGGAAAGFIALVIANSKFDRAGFVFALALVTLASLFKVYFAVFGLVVVASYAAVVPLRTLVVIVFLWLGATFLVYAGLTQIYPNYFEAIFGVIFTDVIHEYFRIIPQLGWFLLNFCFVLAFALPVLAQMPNASRAERHRQIFYLAGSAVVTSYVVFGMLTNIGNFGTYLLNLVAPLILAYALRPRERALPVFERAAGIAATALLCVTVFAVPKYDGTGTVRWTGWTAYGVANAANLSGNRETLEEIARVIVNTAGETVYLDFPLAPAAILNDVAYVDNGNREFIARHKIRKGEGETKADTLVDLVSFGNMFDPVTHDPGSVMREADFVICMLRCPRPETHRLAEDLGPVYMAYNARSFPVRLYLKAERTTGVDTTGNR